MTIEELRKKAQEILDNRTFETCKLSQIKKSENSKKFKYRGVYILTDDQQQIVYIGSAYVRNVRDRLMQYQQEKTTGNSTLYKDLIDAKKCSKKNAKTYIMKLTIHAFEDKSLEYQLINMADGVVNIAGK